MDVRDLFKKPDSNNPPVSTEENKQQGPVEGEVKEEEEFEAKSARLAAELETARDSRDLGDIPATPTEPYHVALNAHRIHESKRKK